jgi:uncharacterized protein (TIGR02996 family)
VTPQEFTYLTEMLMKPQERVFAHLLREDPGDKLTRDAFADWLTDEGRPDAARLVRAGFTPGGSWYREAPPAGVIASGAIMSGTVGPAGGGTYPPGVIMSGASFGATTGWTVPVSQTHLPPTSSGAF